MKSFAHLLNEINEGSTHAALTQDMADLLRTVQTTGRAGKLTITLKVAPAVRNTSGGDIDRINLTVDRTLALPKPETPTDFFYLTEDGETTRNHPKQQTLELREVTSTTPPAQFKEA
ncbi:hypothetical protein [Acidovorax temperans]|jgi:hypothetical protein|uniref:hypothetical protein n=1 Tax=Acidovorax temperans TaxID=80878 RepID=UPI00289BF583|nr:hypothetical protein [Acidovorax temperans]|eukprot:GHVU01125508.1.p3 GENE.GHVU01125508.1~~GHVU01125508.1.p3  ORF type:complete len:117 (-),score=30.42 GHVU01125508.1:306-656(-)